MYTAGLTIGAVLLLLLRRSWRQTRTKIGVVLVVVLVATAAIGPFVAPHSATEYVGAP